MGVSGQCVRVCFMLPSCGRLRPMYRSQCKASASLGAAGTCRWSAIVAPKPFEVLCCSPARVWAHCLLLCAALPCVLLCAMVQGVLHKQWQMQDKQQACASSYLAELQLHSVLGVGGFSTVYAGSWMGSRTAIKVRLLQMAAFMYRKQHICIDGSTYGGLLHSVCGLLDGLAHSHQGDEATDEAARICMCVCCTCLLAYLQRALAEILFCAAVIAAQLLALLPPCIHQTLLTRHFGLSMLRMYTIDLYLQLSGMAA